MLLSLFFTSRITPLSRTDSGFFTGSITPLPVFFTCIIDYLFLHLLFQRFNGLKPLSRIDS
jgi:hypothetical protein